MAAPKNSAHSSAESLVSLIHDTPTQLVAHVTGGGASAIAAMLAVPGASRTVVEANVPYAQTCGWDTIGRSTDGYLDSASVHQKPDGFSFASPDAAIAFAIAAYRRCVAVSSPGTPCAGVAAACALASNRTLKGGTRVHIAYANDTHIALTSASLAMPDEDSGVSVRSEHEASAASMVLHAAAEACGISRTDAEALHVPPTNVQDLKRFELGVGGGADVNDMALRLHLACDDGVDGNESRATFERAIAMVHGTAAASRLLCGRCAYFPPTGAPALPFGALPQPSRRLIAPGSFNPPHRGHVAMMRAASDVFGVAYPDGVVAELSVANADKGVLPADEVASRVASYRAASSSLPLPGLAITQFALFSEKARLFPGSSFVVGYDTAVRIMDKKYTDGDLDKLVDSLVEMVRLGVRIGVAGRADKDGSYKTLEDAFAERGAGISPTLLERVFVSVPNERVDVSSTELRAKENNCTQLR